MSNTDTIIRTAIEKQEAQTQRAIDAGGLPTEAEAAAFYAALTGVGEQLEALAWRIEGIAGSDSEDLPFEVSLEQLGVIAMLASDVEGEIRTLTRLNERAKSRISSLTAIRAEQQFKRGDDA